MQVGKGLQSYRKVFRARLSTFLQLLDRSQQLSEYVIVPVRLPLSRFGIEVRFSRVSGKPSARSNRTSCRGLVRRIRAHQGTYVKCAVAARRTFIYKTRSKIFRIEGGWDSWFSVYLQQHMRRPISHSLRLPGHRTRV